eukprot:504072-Lingulodinium_polyedra.AAC.1
MLFPLHLVASVALNDSLYINTNKTWSSCAQCRHNRTLVHVDTGAQDAPRTGARREHIYGDARMHRRDRHRA